MERHVDFSMCRMLCFTFSFYFRSNNLCHLLCVLFSYFVAYDFILLLAFYVLSIVNTFITNNYVYSNKCVIYT